MRTRLAFLASAMLVAACVHKAGDFFGPSYPGVTLNASPGQNAIVVANPGAKVVLGGVDGGSDFLADVNGNLAVSVPLYLDAGLTGNVSVSGTQFFDNLYADGGTFAGNLTALGTTQTTNFFADAGTFAGLVNAVAGVQAGTAPAGFIGTFSALSAVWLNQTSATASTTNYTLYGDGTNAAVNATGASGTVTLRAANSTFATLAATNVGTKTLSSGTATQTVTSGARCICTDTTANASIKCAVSSTTLTFTGTGTDVIAYFCF